MQKMFRRKNKNKNKKVPSAAPLPLPSFVYLLYIDNKPTETRQPLLSTVTVSNRQIRMAGGRGELLKQL
jgi:hypothetical protein